MIRFTSNDITGYAFFFRTDCFVQNIVSFVVITGAYNVRWTHRTQLSYVFIGHFKQVIIILHPKKVQNNLFCVDKFLKGKEYKNIKHYVTFVQSQFQQNFSAISYFKIIDSWRSIILCTVPPRQRKGVWMKWICFFGSISFKKPLLRSEFATQTFRFSYICSRWKYVYFHDIFTFVQPKSRLNVCASWHVNLNRRNSNIVNIKYWLMSW